MPMRRPSSGRAACAAAHARASPGTASSAAKPSAASAALRARMPGVSSVSLCCSRPSVVQRPRLTLIPTVPVQLAGMRTDPVVSEPSASIDEPCHRPTPAPELEPPPTRCVAPSHGLRGAPQWRLVPSPPNANSTVCVLAASSAAWRRNAPTKAPSRSCSAGSARGVPAQVRKPERPKRSLTETGRPMNGPRSQPAASSASAAAAWRRMSAASKARCALSDSSRRPCASIAASAIAAADRRPARSAPASPAMSAATRSIVMACSSRFVAGARRAGPAALPQG